MKNTPRVCQKILRLVAGVVSVISLAAIDIPMQIVRLTMTDSTSWDYSYGLPLIIGLVITLLFPHFKAVLTVI